MKSKLLPRQPSRNNSTNQALANFSVRPPSPRPLRPSGNVTQAGAAPLPASARAAHWEPKFPFDLVVAYEDEATRARALTLCDHLVRKLQDDHDIRLYWWKFHFLYDPQLLERAVDVALTADMIVMSLANAKEPPVIARTWIERWREEKDGHDCALVALVDNAPSANGDDCALVRHLNSIAHQAGMDFFSHVFPAPPLRAESPYINAPAHGANVLPLVEAFLRRPNNADPWGINEY